MFQASLIGTPNQDFTFVSREEVGFRRKVTTVDGAVRRTIISELDTNGMLTLGFEDRFDTYLKAG